MTRRGMPPPVAVVILHYGPLYVTLRCLRALDRVRYSRLDVVLVDNAGTGPALAAALRGLRRRPRVLAMPGNAGYTGGVNAGVRAAVARGARYVWLLNNDATPAPAALGELVRLADSDDAIAVAGSRILDNEVPPRLWHVGGTIDMNTGLGTSRGAGEPDRGQFSRAEDVDWVTGCSMMVRAERFGDVGLLDHRFIMYYEETDWCLRARADGWRVVTCPRSVVTHHVAGRDERSDGRWLYWETRNRLLLLLNHRRERVLPALVRMIRWPLGSTLLRGTFRRTWWAFRGIVSFVRLAAVARAPAASRSGRSRNQE